MIKKLIYIIFAVTISVMTHVEANGKGGVDVEKKVIGDSPIKNKSINIYPKGSNFGLYGSWNTNPTPIPKPGGPKTHSWPSGGISIRF